jgi:peroxiredoxin Q/BCP
MLKVGERAPDFRALATSGHEVSLGALKGRKVVLYFYPKAFTPGCTAESRRFRDNYDDLRALGAEVIGVSVDEYGTQCEFASRNELRFPLVSDHDRVISKAYGVLWPGIPFDKRVTFVIDESGQVAAVFRHEIQVSKHLDDVLRFLGRKS